MAETDSDFQVRELDEATGWGILVNRGIQYHLKRYEYAGKLRCDCRQISVARTIVWLRRRDMPNPRNYDCIVLWKCGDATWENEPSGFNMSNLFFEN